MRIGTASVRRRAQLLALDPTISVEPLRGNIDTRLRKARSAGSTRSCSPPAASTGSGSPAEIGAAAPRRDDAARGRAGRARAPGARRRGGARRARRLRRDAAAGRGRARVRRAASARAASRRSRRITTAARSTALIAAEDGTWIERRSGADPGGARRRAARRVASATGRVKVIVTRPRAQAQPLVGRLEALGLRRRRVPADRDRAHLRRADRLRRLRVGVVTSPNGADEVARRARNLPKVAAVGPGTAETLREPRDRARRSCASVSTADGLLAEFPRPDGKVIFLAAENSRRGPDRRARGRLRPALQHRAAAARAARGRRRRARVRARPRGRTRGSAARRRRSRSGPRRRASPTRSGSTVAVEAETHDLDGLVAAVERVRAQRVQRVRLHHVPDRLRRSRTTSSASAAA